MASRRITGPRKTLRRVPPNRPGGISFGLSIIHDLGNWTSLTAQVGFGIPSSTVETSGFSLVVPLGGTILNFSEWGAFANQGRIEIISATFPTPGQMLVTFKEAPQGNGWLVVPGYVPQLSSSTGIVCAGAILPHVFDS